MHYYAQISGGICVAVMQSTMAPVAVPGDLIVETPNYDPSYYLGRAYVDGAWA